MATDAIQVKTVPDPYEAFNIAQAYRAGDFVFVSGQAALDLEGNIVGEGDFAAIACIVSEAGGWVSNAGGDPLDLNRADSTFMNHEGVLFASTAEIALCLTNSLSVDP